MEPKTTSLKELEKFIKERPDEANALASRWLEFAGKNPAVLLFQTREDLDAWAKQHSEKNIDTNIWFCKEIADAYLNLKRQQEASGANAQEGEKKEEERQRETARETPRESIRDTFEKEKKAEIKQNVEKTISEPTAPTTYQPRIQTPTRGFFNRGVGRGIGRIERGSARLGGRVGLGIGRLGTRLVTQAGMAAGRAAVGALASNPLGWIALVVIATVFVATVILIIMLAGGGGFGGSAPKIVCLDADGNSIKVADGNACAVNLAAYYSKLTGTSITTKCLDKCTDFLKVVCDRDPATNTCAPPPASCGASEAFCIEYTPIAIGSGRLYDCSTGGSGYWAILGDIPNSSCGGTPISPTPTPASTLAFPGAEGFGAISLGGRGGKVIEVTTLADGVPAPPGSLRACAEASDPRTCVFRVGGTIELSSSARFEIKSPHLTIAGQTAPGGGILITGNTGISIWTHDVVIRYLRFRLLGTGKPGSGQINIAMANGAYNVIVDHCSTSWSLDENTSIFIKESPPSPDMTNITFQRCLIAEALAGHSTGLIISGQDPSNANPNLPTDVYLKVHEISVHHNLFAHNFDRNPRVSNAGTQVINNVVYNWGSHVGVSARKNTVDLINNYWKPGPMSGSLIFKHESTNISTGWIYPDPSIYIAGNIVPGTLEDSAADNWALIIKDPAEGGGPLPLSYRRFAPLAQAPSPVAVQSAVDAYASVLADAGANARLDCSGNWIANSDAVDQRVLADVSNGTGWSSPPDSPGAAGGFPTIASGSACADTDHDGMPDEWETIHFASLSQGSPTDSSSNFDGDGYTDLEEFLNGTDPTKP